MNKVFNINLGGYPFTIDENAYQHLNDYLTSIHNHFRDSEGYEEITGDIEARMAELFQEQLSGRPIVTIKDIKNAIAIMGTPEDFGVEPLEDTHQEETKENKKYKTGKRLFRNPDDEVVGGVCSGLAAYFGLEDPLWIRIIWIFFTVSGGLGIPAYVILWVIVPKAETAGDRLAMKGKKINVSNIGKIVEEEIENFSEKVGNFSNEFQKKKTDGETGEIGSKSTNRIGRAVKKGISLLGLAISKVLYTFSKIGKPIIFIVGFALIIALFVTWIMSIISFLFALPYAHYFFAGSKILTFLGITNVLVFIGVPLLALIIYIFKYIFKRKVSANFKAGMWSFWVINVISLFAVGSYQGAQFSSRSEISENIELTNLNTDTLNIKIESDPYRSASFTMGHLKISDGKLISRDVHLNVLKSETDQFELVQEIYARGNSESEASRLISEVKYDVKVMDNTIVFPRVMEFPKGKKWRAQRIELTLKIPVGKSIYLQGNLWSIGNHIDVDRDQDFPRFDSDQIWLMEENGLVNKEFLRKSQRSEEFTNKDFNHLQIEGRIKLTIQKGEEYKIEMSGKPNYLDLVKLVQLEKTLNINIKDGHRYSPVNITITMPELIALDLDNTEGVNIQGFTQKKMRIKHRGTDEVVVFAKIDSLNLRQAHRSKVKLKGEGIFLEAVLVKSAKLDADRYQVKKAKVEVRSSAKATVAVSDSLWIYRDGGARVDVDGSPVVLEDSATNH